MYILDTDLFSLTDRAETAEGQRLRLRLSNLRPDELATTIITFEEQWLAWLAQARSMQQQIERYQRLKLMVQSYQKVILFDFDRQAADEFERLQKQRLRVGTMDLKIAAIALAHDATLLSRDLKDFSKVPGLKVEDWAA